MAALARQSGGVCPSRSSDGGWIGILPIAMTIKGPAGGWNTRWVKRVKRHVVDLVHVSRARHQAIVGISNRRAVATAT